MQNEMKLWSKLNIISVLQFITLIAIAIYSPFFSISLQNYGWEYVIFNKGMPLVEQAIRVGYIFVISLLAFFSIYSIYLNIKLYKINQYLIYTIGAFNWCLIPYYIIVCKKNNYFKQYKNYLSFERKEPAQISHSHFLKVLTNKAKIDKLFWNTFICYLTLISTIIGMSLIISTYGVTGEKSTNVMFHFFVFFTLLSNEILFVFMIFFIFLHKKYFYRENTMMTYMTGYMLVVALVYWAYLFPQEGSLDPGIDGVESVWLHAINPILIITFCISSYFTNYVAPKHSWHKFALMGTCLPLVYALYAYLLPFVVNFSVYGSLTNLNPSFVNSAGETPGGPIWLLGILVLALLFILCYSILWISNYYIVKIHNKKNQLMNPIIKW